MEILKPLKQIIKTFYKNKPNWLNRQIVLLITTLLVFIIAMVLSEPLPHAAAMQINRQEPKQELVPIPNTAENLELEDFSEDFQYNSQQTNGVIFGGVVLLSIILGGVLTELRQ